MVCGQSCQFVDCCIADFFAGSGLDCFTLKYSLVFGLLLLGHLMRGDILDDVVELPRDRLDAIALGLLPNMVAVLLLGFGVLQFFLPRHAHRHIPGSSFAHQVLHVRSVTHIKTFLLSQQHGEVVHVLLALIGKESAQPSSVVRRVADQCLRHV